MSIILNKQAYEHAVEIIKDGLEVEHDVSNWEEVKPTPDEQVRHLNTHSLDEYGLWFLGIDTDADKDDKSKFLYPYGDFSVLHKSALIVAEQQATQKHHHEIKVAAQKLLAMIK
jgi:hypothetical protein